MDDEVMVGLAALERSPLFAGLDREHLEEVLRVGRRVSFDTGQAIVERGDPGDAMYIMVSGAAEVDVGGRFHRGAGRLLRRDGGAGRQAA